MQAQTPEAAPDPIHGTWLQNGGVQDDPPTIDGVDYAVQGNSDWTVVGWIEDLFFWLVTPICSPCIQFLDWLGVDEAPLVEIDLNAGTVGHLLSITDAWLPVHEAISFISWFLFAYVVWTPIKLGIKYFVPGLG